MQFNKDHNHVFFLYIKYTVIVCESLQETSRIKIIAGLIDVIIFGF